MSLSLSAIALAIANVVPELNKVETVVAGVVSVTQKVLSYASSMMDTVENAYEGIANSGAGKKAAVLAAVQVFVVALGAQWGDFEAVITQWIDTVKTAFNDLKSVVAPAA